jgi:hypothetical protein
VSAGGEQAGRLRGRAGFGTNADGLVVHSIAGENRGVFLRRAPALWGFRRRVAKSGAVLCGIAGGGFCQEFAS